MRTTALAGLGLAAVLAAPAAAAGTTGPFAGQVSQGQTRTHLYDNNPSNGACLQLAATYTISLSHVPAGDTLTLTVDGIRSVTTSGGGASLNVTKGVCATFSLAVTGTSVADSATYVLSVTRQILPPVSVG